MSKRITLDSFNGLSQALQGLQRASERVGLAAQSIAQGDISADSFVELKQSERDFQANAKSLKIQMDTEKDLLDIIA